MKFLRVKFMFQMYKNIFPAVYRNLKYWKKQSNQIPNSILKEQAQLSMKDKFFHCEGGSVFAILCPTYRKEFISFVVAFQTISDYLDNLCDRCHDLNEKHFRQLHLSMQDALTPKRKLHDYYKYGKQKNDGEYLSQLVTTCQERLQDCKGYSKIQKEVLQLNDLYIDLQVYKHLAPDIRVQKLKKWANEKNPFDLPWNVFAAATGSTLGIFMLIAYMMEKNLDEKDITSLYNLYFPHVQGFHILLDYFIDKDEDLAEGDLNFYQYFVDDEEFYQYLFGLYWQVSYHSSEIKDGAFHLLIMHAMLGLYLADPKLKAKTFDPLFTQKLLNIGEKDSLFFYRNVKIYRMLHKTKNLTFL